MQIKWLQGGTCRLQAKSLPALNTDAADPAVVSDFLLLQLGMHSEPDAMGAIGGHMKPASQLDADCHTMVLQF